MKKDTHTYINYKKTQTFAEKEKLRQRAVAFHETRS